MGVANELMQRPAGNTCDDCYFRRAGLCALSLESPCPTFRLHTRGPLVAPKEPRLMPRPLGPLVAERTAA